MKNKIIYCLKEEMLQGYAEGFFERKLSPQEVREVKERIGDYCVEIDSVICEKIEEAMDLTKLLRRSKGADKRHSHFLVYSKNANAYRPNYELAFTASTERDALEYVRLNANNIPFERWKISRVDGRTETDLKVIPSSPDDQESAPFRGSLNV